jgi:ABC-type nitrate/sulfonate/bicarbonate transport system permease component
MSVTFARTEPAQSARIFRGPFVSVLSVAGFLLVWFIAAEIAQSRLLPGPGAVLEYIYKETMHGPWARCRPSTARSIPG